MKKVFWIARRDFLATVTTKAFFIAVLMPLLLYGAIIVGFPRLTSNRAPAMTGSVGVIDPTGGAVAAGMRRYLDPQAFAARREAAQRRVHEAMPGAAASPGSAAAQRAIFGDVPKLEIVERSAEALEAEKADLARADAGGRLAVLVVEPTAVAAQSGGRLGSYRLFVRRSLDNRIQNEIRTAAGEAIVAARLEAAGFDPRRIDALTTVERPPSVTVTAAGESQTGPGVAALLPMGFTILLMISVMSSGQYLLTTTIEEKSSRTMEVLLSAVSPLQLLTGKILGQLTVGLTLLMTYGSIGLLALASMAMLGLLDPLLLLYLLMFFLITYVILGSLMAAIGSAVNELREAQSLMTPITVLIMVPWLFSYPISREPNSLFATVISFLPPMNAFAMLLRLTSSSPPPVWQVWLSILIGVAVAAGAMWFASRIFKIGLLMHGRPPNVATLIRWARQ